MKKFGSFRLDSTDHCLWREGERVQITPKAFDVLRYLVDHPARLVTQDEILKAIWPDVYVNPEVLRKYILEARKALGHRLRSAGLAAHREIVVAAKGLEIEYLQFTFFELTLAVCSRVRRDGIVEIEIGLGDQHVGDQPGRLRTVSQQMSERGRLAAAQPWFPCKNPAGSAVAQKDG